MTLPFHRVGESPRTPHSPASGRKLAEPGNTLRRTTEPIGNDAMGGLPLTPRMSNGRALASAGVPVVVVALGPRVGRAATAVAVQRAALVAAAGILGIAWFMAGRQPAPRRAWWTTAFVMAAGAAGPSPGLPPPQRSKPRRP